MLGPMRTAMVLCAGLGTRLRPLTDRIPKPLMPVGDRPLLAHIVLALARGGIDRVVVNTHHRAAQFEACPSEVGGAELCIVREPEILGTAGGVAHARAELGPGDVVVYNGDIVAPSLDLGALVRAWSATRADAGALWVVQPRPAGRGTVGVDQRGRIVRLRGRVFAAEASGADYLGVQIMGEALRDALPETGCLVADSAIPFLESNGRIEAFAFEADWDDTGNPAGLLRANLRWLARRGARFWVGPGARVSADVTLASALVGAGARIEGRGELRECVVFPTAEARAPLERTIVAPQASVHAA